MRGLGFFRGSNRASERVGAEQHLEEQQRSAEASTAPTRGAVERIDGVDLAPPIPARIATLLGVDASSDPRKVRNGQIVFPFPQLVPAPEVLPEPRLQHERRSKYSIQSHVVEWNPLVGAVFGGRAELHAQLDKLAPDVLAFANSVPSQVSDLLPPPPRDEEPTDAGARLAYQRALLTFFIDPPSQSRFPYGRPIFPAPLDVAIDAGLPEAASALLAMGANPEGAYLGVQRLFAAARRGDHRIVEALLDAGAGVDRLNDLSIRAEIDQYWFAEDPIRQEDGRAAIHAAARSGHLHVVEMLIRRGADVNLKDMKGNTALLTATRAGHKNIARLLLAYGADPRETYKKLGSSSSLLGVAMACRDLDFLKELVEYGADPRLDGPGTLFSAVDVDRRDVLEWLFQAHGFADFMEDRSVLDEWSALGWAVRNGHSQAAQFLWEHGANPSTPTPGGSLLAEAQARVADARRFASSPDSDSVRSARDMEAQVKGWLAAPRPATRAPRSAASPSDSGWLRARNLRQAEEEMPDADLGLARSLEVLLRVRDMERKSVRTAGRSEAIAALEQIGAGLVSRSLAQRAELDSPEDTGTLIQMLEPILGRNDVPLKDVMRALLRVLYEHGDATLNPFGSFAVQSLGLDRKLVSVVLPEKADQHLAHALLGFHRSGHLDLDRDQLDQLLLGFVPVPGRPAGAQLAAARLFRALNGDAELPEALVGAAQQLAPQMLAAVHLIMSPITLTPMSDPRLLSCGHSLDRDDIAEMIARGDGVRCPCCRAVTQPEDAANAPSYEALKSLSEGMVELFGEDPDPDPKSPDDRRKFVERFGDPPKLPEAFVQPADIARLRRGPPG